MNTIRNKSFLIIDDDAHIPRSAAANAAFRSAWLGYAGAIIGTIGAACLHKVLIAHVGEDLSPFITFPIVVVFSSLFGGTGAGILATFLSAAAVTMFLPPKGFFLIGKQADVVGLILFASLNLVIGVLGGALRSARKRVEQQARQLAAMLTALESANVNLEKQVQQRTAQLHETVTDLEHMSYSMIHDMRAPLRAMSGFIEILEEEYSSSPRAKSFNYFQRVRESAFRMDRLITDALNYNQVVREQMPITTVEVVHLLHGMIQSYPNLSAEVADISIEFNELHVRGNLSLLTQCFGNLLGNAVKFVPTGGRPQVRVWAEPNVEKVRIWVEDNGIGIPKEAQERIFRMFQRRHRESEYPGTGIGLAIVKKAVERMGGSVGVESEPGKGSNFWVELPTAARPQPKNRVITAA